MLQRFNVQMKDKFSGLLQCNSQQNFTLPYYYPLSPLSKAITPHRPRPNHTTYASPIAFLSTNHHDRSPGAKENQPASLNQSPMTNIFSQKAADCNHHQKRTISNMDAKMASRSSYHNYHKSDPNSDGNQGQYTNFQQTLRSITQKSPQGHAKSKLKMRFSNNFQGILQAQDYQIKQKGQQSKKTQEPFCKKPTYQHHQSNERLFSSCLRQSQKRGPLQPSQRREQLLCINDDGNIAKYITMTTEDDDQRLYYCSKCTVLLVNQGFILEEIKKNKVQTKALDAEELTDKIEACRDKLGSLINDLSMRESFELAKVGQFYQGLGEVLEKCRRQNELRVKSLYEEKIREYESILQEVDIFSQNIKETYQNLSEFEGLHQQILQFSLGTPLLNKYDTSQLNQLQSSFSNLIQEQFTLIPQLKPIPSDPQPPSQSLVSRNHGLRFSFQKLLHDISSKKSRMQDIIISSLAEEQQSDGLEVVTQKTAFRDLFPQDNSQINSSLNSPTFKHI